MLLVAGWLLVLVGVLLGLSPWLRVPLDVVAMVGAFSAYGVLVATLGAVLALIGLVLSRPAPWPLVLGVVASLLITAAVVALQAPHWLRDDRPAAGGPRVTVVSMNLEFGRADPAAIVAATSDADVVTFTETTNQAVRRLSEAGFDDRFGYRLSDVTLPDRGAEGTMVYARWPLASPRDLAPGSQLQNWLTAVDVPGLGRVQIAAVHARRPHLSLTEWLPEQQAIVAGLPTDPLTVVAGDFNATGDQLRVPGYVSAADVLGLGTLRTFPAHAPVPPLIRIDHVLLGPGLTATALTAVEIPRTDHLALRTVIGKRR